MNTRAPTFLIGSSSFFHVTRTAMRSRMSSKFRKIRPWTAELAALERLKKSPWTYHGKDVLNAPAPSFRMGSYSFWQATRSVIRSRISSKFSEFRPWTAELPALECLKNLIFCFVATLAPSILIGSSSYLEVTRIAITSRMSSNFIQIRPLTAVICP